MVISRYKTLAIFTFLIWVGASKARSQGRVDSVNKWSISLQILGNRNSVIDKNFSALPYSGNNLGASTSIAYQKKRALHNLKIEYSEGDLETAFQDKSTQERLNLDYCTLYQFGTLTSTSQLKFYGGGSINFLYAARNYPSFTNNNDSFEAATSLSASVKVVLTPKNKLYGFLISNHISVPVISAIQQPAFGSETSSGSINSDGSKLKSIFDNQEIAGFSDFFRVKNELSLGRKLTRKQLISLSYLLDYYHIKSQREVKQSRHSFGLSYSYLF